MDKSLFIYILVGISFFYLITNFVSSIQEEDVRYRNNEYNQEHQYDKYNTIDSVGDTILDISELTPTEQIDVWNKNDLREEMIELFPDFTAMKEFIQDRVVGEPLSKKLIAHVDDAEYQYFSGALTAQKTKQMLGAFK